MASDDEEEMSGLGGLSDLFAQFEQAQERIESAAAEASGTIVEGSAGDGRVVVQLSGDLDAVSVHIDPSLVDPSDVGLLEDLLLAAIRDGLGQVAELQGEVAGAFGGGTGGLDVAGLLGSLGNLPGLGGIGSLGGLGSFDIGAMANLPGLGALGGLGIGIGQFEDDGDPENEAEVGGGAHPGGPAGSESAGARSESAGTPAPGQDAGTRSSADETTDGERDDDGDAGLSGLG